MKSIALVSLLTALAAATPILPRQARVGISASEFTDNPGECRDIIMIFARGSTEAGDMGTVVGPPTANALKQSFGADRVAVEGVPYAARLAPNALPGGTDSASTALMRDLITAAAERCPDSALVVGGYSQGAAVTHRAVEDLPQGTKDQIAAAFMYGDTQNVQDDGQIPNFDPAKTNIICNNGDLVCRGTLTILAPHLTYGTRVDEQVDFITGALASAGVTPA